MSMNDRFILSNLYRLASESEKSKNMVYDLVSRELDRMNKELKDLKELIKEYELLKNELNK